MKVAGGGFRLALVGPFPPPAGGMANQTKQLEELLRSEGISVEVVRHNRPYAPACLGRLPWVRALGRLIPYMWDLWKAGERASIFHVMANSGWSWHLFAAPAIVIARLRKVAVVVNYRGGEAEQFFRRSYFFVRPVLRLADALVVPSGFLHEVFGRRGVQAQVVPNIVDTDRFRTGPEAADSDLRGAHLVVARNLEAIYDNATAVRAFRLVKDHVPEARLTIAGTGPAAPALHRLVEELGLADAVVFAGQVENTRMPELYRSAAVAINPSLVDNMPISVLEALASGVPVVSTDVGGIPYLVEDGRTALLVPPGEPARMADAVLRLLRDSGLAERLAEAGQAAVLDYSWDRVRDRLFAVYEHAWTVARTRRGCTEPPIEGIGTERSAAVDNRRIPRAPGHVAPPGSDDGGES